MVKSEAKLSKLAVNDGHGEDSPYFDGWKAYDKNPYHQDQNPLGIIQMGLAENQICTDLIEEWLDKQSQPLAWKGSPTTFKETALYQDYHGLSFFRQALACFMEKVRGKRVMIDPKGLVLAAGATAASEILTFCIANPGEALLVPTPYYPGFDRDLRWRTGVEIIPVECCSNNNFQITRAAMDEAYKTALNNNQTIKAIFITNPSNPLGLTTPPQTMLEILDFAKEKTIHVIADEVYAGTVFSSQPFTSILELVQSSNKYDPDSVHIIYSLSKDLGMPGFRIGVIYSANQTITTAARRMSSFSLPSSQTQLFLTSMLSDEEFVSKYLTTLKERLRRRHRVFASILREMGIDSFPGNSGLFCWVNPSKLMGKTGWEGELDIWKMILEQIRLNVSPGCSFKCGEPGWFRVCYGNMSEDVMGVALARIKSFLSNGHTQVKDAASGNGSKVPDSLVLSSDIAIQMASCLARP